MRDSQYLLDSGKDVLDILSENLTERTVLNLSLIHIFWRAEGISFMRLPLTREWALCAPLFIIIRKMPLLTAETEE